MIGTLYIESEVADHPRTAAIAARFPKVPRVPIGRYGEVFNRSGQNFRLQKQRPALVLARKYGQRVLATPEGYGIGGERNFYFSHMLNCLYDCRYCFLQGMFRSAALVVFVDFEDFFEEIERTTLESQEPSWFFSGYDCDSLAFEGATSFVEETLPVIRRLPRAHLEVRTKSVHIEPLKVAEPIERVVVAFSFTPEPISRSFEPGVPSIERRLRALAEVRSLGWPVGLRFDPLVYSDDFRTQYRELFERVFRAVPGNALHSVSFGPLRLPSGFYRRLERLHPDSALLAGPFEDRQGTTSYAEAIETDLLGFVSEELRRHVPEERFFPCSLGDGA